MSLRIGIDFDNTIVNYHGVFYRTAVALGWLPAEVGQAKSAVKQYFLDQNNEPKWTELQGIVYGRAIADAKPYEGALKVIADWHQAGHQLFLVSHKTQYPVIGDKLDFHQAARQWLEAQGLTQYFQQLHFCPEKTLKIATAAELQLDAFIDDLSNVLLHLDFPADTQKILFCADNPSIEDCICADDWLAVGQIVTECFTRV